MHLYTTLVLKVILVALVQDCARGGPYISVVGDINTCTLKHYNKSSRMSNYMYIIGAGDEGHLGLSDILCMQIDVHTRINRRHGPTLTYSFFLIVCVGTE